MFRENRIYKKYDIGCLEDELYILLFVYKDLCELYLPKHHINNPNLRKFVDILHSNNGKILRSLSLCIYKSLKMRNGAGKKQLRFTTVHPKGDW